MTAWGAHFDANVEVAFLSGRGGDEDEVISQVRAESTLVKKSANRQHRQDTLSLLPSSNKAAKLSLPYVASRYPAILPAP